VELSNEFEVAVPVDSAWDILTDVERIAPCLPGAELREVEGDEYRGAVKIKVGPITTTYEGTVRFLERDRAGRRAVLSAEGRETRGQGNASAVITATMSPSDAGTKVVVATELAITGRVAQFGRGVLADVSAALLDRFVTNLESTVLASGNDDPGDAAPTSPVVDESAAPSPTDVPPPSVRPIASPAAAPIDVVGLAGPSIARRLVKPAAVAAVFVALAVRKRRRRT